MIRTCLRHNLLHQNKKLPTRPPPVQLRLLHTSNNLHNQFKNDPRNNNLLNKDYEITFHRQRQCKFHLSLNPEHKVYMMINTQKTGKLQYSWQNGSPKDKTILFIAMYFLGVAAISTVTAAFQILFSPFGIVLLIAGLLIFYV